MHLAHKVRWTWRPPSITCTRCKFGENLRRVALIEKLRLCPKVVVFPQCAHFAIDQDSFLAG